MTSHIATPITSITLTSLFSFADKIKEADNGCHEWNGTITQNGYGQLYMDGKRIPAHRFAYFLAHGEIDRTLTIDHLCRNRACVNPEHLELVTASENSKRMIAANYRTHCPRGHALEGGNLIQGLLKRGHDQGRACRACDVSRRAASHRKLVGEERERFIQISADSRVKQYLEAA